MGRTALWGCPFNFLEYKKTLTLRAGYNIIDILLKMEKTQEKALFLY